MSTNYLSDYAEEDLTREQLSNRPPFVRLEN
jgi:hypothetical protein